MKRIMTMAFAGLLLAHGAANAAASSAGPETEAKVAAILADYAAKAEQADNDMAKGGLRTARAHELCAAPIGIKADSGRVSQWTGTVSNLSATDDGRGVLAIKFAENATVETVNNALSESVGPHTLIPAGSGLFQDAVKLKEGEKVVFSGVFWPSKVDCMQENSLTTGGSLSDPEFLFRFSSVAPAP